MQNRILSAITLLTIVPALFISCGKDVKVKTKTELITSSSWKFDHATSGGADISPFINACYKDNEVTFSANGNGSFDEGATKCNSGDPQTFNFTWSFMTNETILNVSAAIFAGQSGNFTIITLTETSLVLEGTVTTSGGNVTAQIFLKH